MEFLSENSLIFFLEENKIKENVNFCRISIEEIFFSFHMDDNYRNSVADMILYILFGILFLSFTSIRIFYTLFLFFSTIIIKNTLIYIFRTTYFFIFISFFVFYPQFISNVCPLNVQSLFWTKNGTSMMGSVGLCRV